MIRFVEEVKTWSVKKLARGYANGIWSQTYKMAAAHLRDHPFHPLAIKYGDEKHSIIRSTMMAILKLNTRDEPLYA